ncbi:MAG: DUF1559 domain-containing protein [Gemmataceae bacterium]
MPRPALSLIELLVSIAIIAVLLALVLTAVQKVRGRASRAECQNQLRQIALATQQYHTTFKKLPRGVGADKPDDPYPYLNWSAHLLPYLERNDLWEQIPPAFKLTRDFQNDPPHTARGIPVSAFRCPADPRLLNAARFEAGKAYDYGLTSYLGVTGSRDRMHDGLLYSGSRHTLTDCRDGTSNTLLIGERPPSGDLRFGWWYAGQGMEFDGSADGVLSVEARCRKGTYCSQCGSNVSVFGPGNEENFCDFLHFYSHHSSGANFAFADGSVRFLTYDAEKILPALATRAGKESVSVPE